MENAVLMWWASLSTLGIINIGLWFYLNRKELKSGETNLMIWLCFIYVIVCFYRSALPRADVQRMMLFDTWFSSVFLGRSAATIAELAFVAQWAILLNKLSDIYRLPIVRSLAIILVPLIAIAEVFSWYGVILGFNMAHAYEESLWAVTFLIVIVAFGYLIPHVDQKLKKIFTFVILGCSAYVAFMVLIDIPMYYTRHLADLEAGKTYPDFWQGIKEVNYKRIISWDYQLWKDEIPWMTGYFSLCVYSSLGITVFFRQIKSK